MLKAVGFIDMSPKNSEKCCQNCMHFYKWGVHLGICAKSNSNKDKLDTQCCKKFELKITE